MPLHVQRHAQSCTTGLGRLHAPPQPHTPNTPTAHAHPLRRAEQAHKQVELAQVAGELAQFEAEQAQQRALREAAVAQLRAQRAAQLEEQATRRAVAAQLSRRAEEALSARIALDVKGQIEVRGVGRQGKAWRLRQ